MKKTWNEPNFRNLNVECTKAQYPICDLLNCPYGYSNVKAQKFSLDTEKPVYSSGDCKGGYRKSNDPFPGDEPWYCTYKKIY